MLQTLIVFKKGDNLAVITTKSSSYRSIVKVVSKLFFNCLRPVAKEQLPESQCGSQASKDTVGMISIAGLLSLVSKPTNPLGVTREEDNCRRIPICGRNLVSLF